MNKGFTLVELLIAIVGMSVLSILSMIFFIQVLESHDKALAVAEATDVANSILTRIETSVKTGTTFTLTGSTVLKIEEDDQCEVYSLNNQAVYYDITLSPNPCPSPTTTNRISNVSANVTNVQSPAITLFTGIPSANPVTITTEIRVRVAKMFGSSEVTLKNSASRRR